MRGMSRTMMVPLLALLACKPEEEEENAPVPPLLAPFCEAIGDDTWDCEDESIALEGFVDLVNLPGVRLVSTPDDYGRLLEMVPVLHPDGEIESLTTGYAEDLNERLSGPPIKAEVRQGTIRKVLQPGNGVLIPTWHVEIASADDILYFSVAEDGTETPIER